MACTLLQMTVFKLTRSDWHLQ